jgi:hypothetical protein
MNEHSNFQVSKPFANSTGAAASAGTFPSYGAAGGTDSRAPDSPGGSLGKAVLGGLIALVVGAGLWAAISSTTGMQIGWMAIGVGFLVGFAVRWLGRGTEPVYGYLGALLALIGCLLGNVLAYSIILARFEGVGALSYFFSVLPTFGTFIFKNFQPIDLLFYALAMYQGYSFSFRKAPLEH